MIKLYLVSSLEEKGCKGGRATFSGHEYILLLKGGRRVSTNMETTLKSV
jgi:hypothetical protein